LTSFDCHVFRTNAADKYFDGIDGIGWNRTSYLSGYRDILHNLEREWRIFTFGNRTTCPRNRNVVGFRHFSIVAIALHPNALNPIATCVILILKAILLSQTAPLRLSPIAPIAK